MNSARRGEKRSIFLSLGNRKWTRDNLEEKRLDMNLKDGYDLMEGYKGGYFSESVLKMSQYGRSG